MPYETNYIPAELFIEHAGVKVYHTYKGNEVDQGQRTYWFDNREDSDDDGDSAFDVRDLHEQLAGCKHDYETELGRMAIVRDAIDAGIVKRGTADDVELD